MTRKSSEAKNTPARPEERRMTAQERNVADTAVIPNKHEMDPHDASLGFGPRSFDRDRVTERLSLRDPEEPTQGPLRFDETNYSVERLTLPEGGYNEYADEVSSYYDEEGTPRMNHGPVSGGIWQNSYGLQNPQYEDSTQSDLLDELPSGDLSPALEPDDPDLAFRLTAEELKGTPEGDAYFERDAEAVSRASDERSQPKDVLIREKIDEALDANADIDAADISLYVRDGTVTIEGEVADATVRHRIEQCVQSVEGVKDINNRLHLAAPQPRKPWSEE